MRARGIRPSWHRFCLLQAIVTFFANAVPRLCMQTSLGIDVAAVVAAPEVICAKTHYDGEKADIWSCGVMLYVMLFCEYPFERPEDEADKHGFQKVHALGVRGAHFSSAAGEAASVRCTLYKR